MKQLADDLWMLSGFPPNGINVYIAGDVLIDGDRIAALGSVSQTQAQTADRIFDAGGRALAGFRGPARAVAPAAALAGSGTVC